MQTLVITIVISVVIGVSNAVNYEDHDVVREFIQGKTKWGEWGDYLLCAQGVRVMGFRLKVDRPGASDDTALNGIQLACADGTVTKQIKGVYGDWVDWKYCEEGVKLQSSKFVKGFKFRSEGNQGGEKDDVAGTNVRMICNDGKELDGDGEEWGTWDSKDYESCPKEAYFCGLQTRNEGNQHNGDDTAMNQIKFICCKPEKEIVVTETFIMGKTSFGRWSETIMCDKSGQVSGFRLKVEGSMGGDDTALNGIQLICKDGSVTKKIDGPFGSWKPWNFCEVVGDHAYYAYVTGFNFRSEGPQYSRDDTAGNNVKVKCNNQNIIEGQGTKWGSWDHESFHTCPYESFLCGVQARIEGKQYGGDDTGLNQLRFICCRVEEEKCPIIVEPLGCFVDKTYDRTMPIEILNERDPSNPNFVGDHYIDWFNFPKYLPAFRCRCAKKAASLGYKAFGIQMYAECWSGPKAHLEYNRQGKTANCVDTKYQTIAHELQECPVQTGIPNTNFVYKISSVDAECTVGFSPVGCYEDFMDIPRPVPNYTHNERDDTIPGFNGIYIDWKNWNKYHKRMICRCAEAARKMNHEVFSIQFWGECWTSFRNETEYDRDGPSTRCRGMDFKPCPCNSFHCVGMHQANYVYRTIA